MEAITDLTNKLIEFRKERDWEQFHNPKDMALSLTLEAAEVLEHFQWKNGEVLEEYIKSHKEHLGDELADVFGWILLIAHDLGIDIIDAMNKKIAKNVIKYPIEKTKGKSDKYTSY